MALAIVLRAGLAAAQELEPRAYSANPVGANFLVAGYGYTSGDVILDPSLPVRDASATAHTASLGYVRTFGLLGRSANVGAVAPYVWAHAEGAVGGNQRQVSPSGFADPRLRLAVNLVGGPALTPAEFAKREEHTTLGASVTVVPPLGQYDSRKLVNIGSNRWSFKPELGLSHPIGRWDLDAYGGAWLFTENPDFFGGHRREQDPIWTAQTHVSYSLRPRLWLAADGTFYTGGRTTVDGIRKADRQENSRVGLTLALPVSARHSVKLAWTTGVTSRLGGNFDTVSVAWQYFWFDRALAR